MAPPVAPPAAPPPPPLREAFSSDDENENAPPCEIVCAEAAFAGAMKRLHRTRPEFWAAAAQHDAVRGLCFKTTWALVRSTMTSCHLSLRQQEEMLPRGMSVLAESVVDVLSHSLRLVQLAPHETCSICSSSSGSHGVEMVACGHRFHLRCACDRFLRQPSPNLHCPFAECLCGVETVTVTAAAGVSSRHVAAPSA